jgi:hypothetical protein
MSKTMNNKVFLFSFSLMVLLGANEALASSCSLQPELKGIQREMSRVRPDPMNEKTIDAQDKIVDRTIAFVNGLSSCSLKDAELTDLVKHMVKTMAYDPDNQMGDMVGPSIKGPFLDKLVNRAKDLEKKKAISRQQLLEFVAAITVATEAEGSQDDEAPAEDEVAPENG